MSYDEEQLKIAAARGSCIVSGMYDAPLQGKIYHYTSSEGFKGIIENKYIYYTDCKFLNDTKERVEINKIFNDFLQYKQRINAYENEFFCLLQSYQHVTYEGKEYGYFNQTDLQGKQCSYFIFSCSMERDNLSLWKYFSKGNGYQGYNMGLFFDMYKASLQAIKVFSHIKSGQVIYTRRKKYNVFKAFLDPLYEYWKINSHNEESNQKIIKIINNFLAEYSLFFKNEFFYAEKEYRMVLAIPADDLDELKYDFGRGQENMYSWRETNGHFIPYIKVPVFEEHDEHTVLPEIILAPQHQSKIQEESIKKYLAHKGFPNTSVYSSEIPLRY